MAAVEMGVITMPVTRKLGVCSWTFGDCPLKGIARRLAALEYDGVELMGDLSAYTPDEAASVLHAHHLHLFSLTPDNVDLAHPDGEIRAAAIAYYLNLIQFAAGFDNRPLVSCHGFVGRVRAISSQSQEYTLFVEAVQTLAKEAARLQVKLVIEVLNRYESHLVNTASQAVTFVSDVGADNVGILLDAYHMNIEEPDPAAAIRTAGSRLWLYHAADSNRQAVGHGHTDFIAQMAALADVGYRGPVIMECTAPGPDPFSAIKDDHSIERLQKYLTDSRTWFANYQG
jgi:D-psicose/D-tagatose/L-ribulose 3-epimerase